MPDTQPETQLLPVVALVGRANVGKSTLFNRLTRSRDAIVADLPGLTRDRHYGLGRLGAERCRYLVVDTGGFEPLKPAGIKAEMAKQTEQAIAESDLVLFVVDARAGVQHDDQRIAHLLRRLGKASLLVVNKAEGMGDAQQAARLAEFFELGAGTPYSISAAHGDGVSALMEHALSLLPAHLQEQPQAQEGDDMATDAPRPKTRRSKKSSAPPSPPKAAEAAEAVPSAANDHRHAIKLAIIGRPNVGKSTLVNTLLGEERVVAFDEPGTTRDAIAIPFERDGQPYTLIDTAGLRRRGRVFETVEKVSAIKTLQAIENCNVALLLLDATQDISDQDAHIAGFALEAGRALVVAINKWDALDAYQREQAMQHFQARLPFLGYADCLTISAARRQGLRPLLAAVRKAHASAFCKLSTPRLTRALQAAVEKQQPARAGAFRPKLRYAHQGGSNPPVIVIHGNSLDHLSNAYLRYLEGFFRQTFDLHGTPLRIQVKSGANQFDPGRDRASGRRR